MSITYVKGDIFKSTADALVNPVNTVGVSGEGLALQFKHEYPKSYLEYKKACLNNSFKLGEILSIPENNKIIMYFPTQKHWRYPSRLKWVKESLKTLVTMVQMKNIKSIAIPPLGCGLGGLDCEDVYEEITNAFNPIKENLEIYIYLT